jgi:hypothetical protein
VSRIRPIGDDDDGDEGEDCGDGPQNVGNGCAEFTPTDVSPLDHLRLAAKIALKLRKSGAVQVQIGDFIVVFPNPQAAVEAEAVDD